LLKKIAARAIEEKCEFIATTTKDAVKMLDKYIQMQQQDYSLPALAVIHSDIEFIRGEELLFSRINDLFKTHS
jgi:LPS O-antigen subunit length determinant protein (WzzB/FepE family)